MTQKLRQLLPHLTRSLTGLVLILIGTGLMGDLRKPSVGLIILGSLLLVGFFIRLTNGLSFILLVMILALTVDVRFGVFLVPYGFYRLLKFLFWKKSRPRASVLLTYDASLPFVPPNSYHSYLECRAYLERDAKRSKAVSCVGTHGVFGTRWHYGPIWFEQYIGDKEPMIERDGPLRVVIWQSLRPSTVPTGWRESNFFEHIAMTGFATPPLDQPYSEWSHHAKRHLQEWHKQTAWEIVTPTLEEFIAAYRKAPQGRLLKYLFIRTLRSSFKNQPGLMHLRGVKRRGMKNAPLESGFAALDIPEAKQSKHFISFQWPSTKKDPVSVGLMADWFEHAQKHDLTTLDFGVFWTQGDPESWKGFSRFKSQFGVTMVRYPTPRVRIVGSLLRNFRV